MKGIHIRKEKLKLFLFVNDMISYKTVKAPIKKEKIIQQINLVKFQDRKSAYKNQLHL